MYQDALRALMQEYEKSCSLLHTMLRRLRDDAQDGYSDVADGKFVAGAVISATPEELNTIFRLVGVVPDAIVPLGDCSKCVHAESNGQDSRWDEPCKSCKRPRMTNFVPVSSLTKKALTVSKIERVLLTNARDGNWWAYSIVMNENVSKKKRKSQLACGKKVKAHLEMRGLLRRKGADQCRLTMKGRLALEKSPKNVRSKDSTERQDETGL
jgi:hypothetical protein